MYHGHAYDLIVDIISLYHHPLIMLYGCVHFA